MSDNDPARGAGPANGLGGVKDAFAKRWQAFRRQFQAKDLPQASHYTYAPDSGLYGRWPLTTRTAGLEPLLAIAEGRTVLDLGSADGGVAKAFLETGRAAAVHCLEHHPDRVAAANEALAGWPQSWCRQADLVDLPKHGSASFGLQAAYDIVLYCGIHQHLPRYRRKAVLKKALALSHGYLAIRTPQRIFDRDKIERLLAKGGFARWHSAPAAANGGSEIRIFYRPPTG